VLRSGVCGHTSEQSYVGNNITRFILPASSVD
jgi:hypothetical protein